MKCLEDRRVCVVLKFAREASLNYPSIIDAKGLKQKQSTGKTETGYSVDQNKRLSWSCWRSSRTRHWLWDCDVADLRGMSYRILRRSIASFRVIDETRHPPASFLDARVPCVDASNNWRHTTATTKATTSSSTKTTIVSSSRLIQLLLLLRRLLLLLQQLLLPLVLLATAANTIRLLLLLLLHVFIAAADWFIVVLLGLQVLKIIHLVHRKSVSLNKWHQS